MSKGSLVWEVTREEGLEQQGGDFRKVTMDGRAVSDVSGYQCHYPLVGVRVGHFYKWKMMSPVLR